MSASAAFDTIVIGAGHNGLVCAAYLARAGQKVLVLEARSVLGGPCGTFEFLPGYRAAFANSPGSFEPRFVHELELERFGLQFIRTDPTVIHHFPAGCFVGWRDRDRVAKELDAFADGEAQRYFDLLQSLEDLARHLGVSLFEPSPDLSTIAKRVPSSHRRLFESVFFGSMTQLLDERLRSTEAKVLLGMVGLATIMVPPSAPGSAIGLMLRPFSLASAASDIRADDPRRSVLRGSTGLPLGGMGKIVDALAESCRAHGGVLRTNARVVRVLEEKGAVRGVVLADGETITANNIVSAINPVTLFDRLLPQQAIARELRQEVTAIPMPGSAFKIALALDGVPDYAGLPSDLTAADAARVQFRIAPSLGYLERAMAQALAGQMSDAPIMWGLIPSATSPQLAPKGHHILSVNAWYAPYRLAAGTWDSAQRDAFGRRCIEALSDYMPDLAKRIVGARFMDPVEIEAELDLVHSNITHGEMVPPNLFGTRPHTALSNYRTPLHGLYLSGSGTWPGGYVTGIPGHNTSQALLSDLGINASAGEHDGISRPH